MPSVSPCNYVTFPSLIDGASLWALSVLSLVPSVIRYNCHLLFSLLWIAEEEKNRITSQNCPCQTQSTLGPSQTGFRSFHVCALCSTGSPWKQGATKYYCYLLAEPVAMLPTQLPQRISPWHQRLSSIVPFLCEPSLTSLTE